MYELWMLSQVRIIILFSEYLISKPERTQKNFDLNTLSIDIMMMVTFYSRKLIWLIRHRQENKIQTDGTYDPLVASRDKTITGYKAFSALLFSDSEIK